MAATSSAGVTAELVADGLGNGPLGTPSGYFGTFTSQPIGFITGNAARMMITTAGNVGIGTLSPSALLETDAPANSTEVAISARGGSTSTAINGAAAIVATGGLNTATGGLQGGFGWHCCDRRTGSWSRRLRGYGRVRAGRQRFRLWC